jgi:hypothetical protein
LGQLLQTFLKNFSRRNSWTNVVLLYQTETVSAIDKAVLAGFCGAIAKTITYPLDTVRKRLQIQGFEQGRKALGETHKYENLRHCFEKMYQSEGLAGFYKGYIPGITKAWVSSAIFMSLFESMKKWIVEFRIAQNI